MPRAAASSNGATRFTSSSRAEQVDRLLERGLDLVEPGVVHDDVDPAVPLDGSVHERAGRAGVAQVALDGERVAKAGRDLLESLEPARREDDPRAGGVEHPREPGTEPRARAGHDGDAVVEAEGGERIQPEEVGSPAVGSATAGSVGCARMPISKPFLAFLVVAFLVVLAWRLFHQHVRKR